MISKLFDDKRKIKGIYASNNTSLNITAGENGVTKIEVYKEKGQKGFIPWFAIYKNDEIIGRVDALGLGVVYYLENKEN